MVEASPGCIRCGDAVGVASGRLRNEIRVGEEWTGHGNHVGLSIGQDLLGNLGSIDPIAGDQRDGYLPFSSCVTQEKAARGTLVAMVGIRASCQPIPVLRIVAPAALNCLGERNYLF